MDRKTELKIRRLTQNQAKALKAIVSTPSSIGSVVSGTYISTASGLTGNALGGTVSALERGGIIQPFGKERRQFNWELTDLDLIKAKKEDPKTLLNILGRISGETRK